MVSNRVSNDLLDDYPVPILKSVDYFILFFWDDYVKQHPNHTRNEMYKALRTQWRQQSPERKFPFETLSKEHRNWYIQEMHKIDPKWDENSLRVSKLRDLDKQVYGPACFYFMYLKCNAMLQRFPGR